MFQQGSYAVAVKKPRRAGATLHAAEPPEGRFSRDALVYLLGSAHAMLTSRLPELQLRSLTDADYFVLNVLSLG